jgi:membrane-associated phospholipid phosphatase
VFKNLKNTIVDNLYFFLPFLLWIIIGGVLLLIYTKSELFFTVNGAFNPFLDKLNTAFSGYGRGDVIPIILLSLLLIPAYRNHNYIFTTLIFGVLIPSIIFFSKLYFDTPRPLKYYGLNKVHTVPWLDNLFETSFPSGHTIGAFGFFLLLSLYLPKYLKPWSILFFILALACAYSRLYLGQHFFEDVYAGSIIGTVFTFIIYGFGNHFITPKPIVGNE